MIELFQMSPEDMAKYEADSLVWGRQSMREMEERYKGTGHAVTWIEPEPKWDPSPANWDMFLDCPTEPCIRTFRLALIGGGQIRVREQFKWSGMDVLRGDSWGPGTWSLGTTELMVTAHTTSGVTRVAGKIEGTHSDINSDAVIMPIWAQEIADRTVATLQAIAWRKENFLALLDGSQGCAICKRPLRDEVSKLVAVGPDCARQWKIPHSMQAASQRLELRRKLLRESEALMPACV